ncbi:MAG: DUF3800 domain-containing protein [Clostridia bacterium]
MNIYIDESGSINNKFPSNKSFIICLLYVHESEKKNLQKAYKRFISSNFAKLQELDNGKMFLNGKFKEFKGSCFNYDLKNKFIDFFSAKPYFDIFYIHIDNSKLKDVFCSNTARAFNYTLKSALKDFIVNGYLPNENCHLQLDERNEKTESKYFLKDYLNTELTLEGITDKSFDVTYFDSTNNRFVQIADVFANIYFSEILKGNFTEKINNLLEIGMIKKIYKFPCE